MANYALENSSAIAAFIGAGSSYATLAWLSASTQATGPALQLRRAKIYDLLMGTVTTPADNYVEYNVARGTAVQSSRTFVGIASSFALQLDPADATCASFAAVNSSVESLFTFTTGVDPFYVGVNQRASYRWVAAPGSEIVMAAVSSNSLHFRSRGTTAGGGFAGNTTVTLLFQEQ